MAWFRLDSRSRYRHSNRLLPRRTERQVDLHGWRVKRVEVRGIGVRSVWFVQSDGDKKGLRDPGSKSEQPGALGGDPLVVVTCSGQSTQTELCCTIGI